jgi:hypothetical protein
MVFWMMVLPFYFGKNEDVAKIKKILIKTRYGKPVFQLKNNSVYFVCALEIEYI